ncbi:MAG: hypothetical protein ACD_75C01633G0003 [uncultured bacterium]|nr:MAG: hypothetical protein ACD_75C01633G0003 [uncultured bacterium]
MAADKRRFSRIFFNVRARLAVEDKVYTVERIVNLSVGGCLLEITDELPRGRECAFTILLPRMAPGVEVFGEIVRTGDGEASIKFVRITPENLVHLQNIIRYNAADPDLIEEEIKTHPGLK